MRARARVKASVGVLIVEQHNEKDRYDALKAQCILLYTCISYAHPHALPLLTHIRTRHWRCAEFGLETRKKKKV